MWSVRRHTRKDVDYTNYKEAATTEIKNLKEAMNKKYTVTQEMTARLLYAYARNKQNVLYKIGPLEDSAGNVISQGFLKAEDLNG